MKKRPSIAAWILGIAMIAGVIWLTLPRDRKEVPADRKGGVQVPREQADDAGTGASEQGGAGGEPVRDVKFKECPGPDEVARLRRERKRREVVERMDELKKGGLGDVHPRVRALAEALEKLEAEKGGVEGPLFLEFWIH